MSEESDNIHFATLDLEELFDDKTVDEVCNELHEIVNRESRTMNGRRCQGNMKFKCDVYYDGTIDLSVIGTPNSILEANEYAQYLRPHNKWKDKQYE